MSIEFYVGKPRDGMTYTPKCIQCKEHNQQPLWSNHCSLDCYLKTNSQIFNQPLNHNFRLVRIFNRVLACETTYQDTILSIINLGHDTDTSAAIAGGLAGIYYGTAGIPEDWISSLARMEDIIDLGNRLDAQYEV